MNEEKLKAWLLENHTKETTKIYLCDIKVFLDFMTEEKALTASWRDILQYTEYLRKKYPNPKTIRRILYSIKAWYMWLLHTGQREDHPCRSLKIRDVPPINIQLQDLLTRSELQLLTNRKERFKDAHMKNKVIIGLLVHQALRPAELVQIKVDDIDLEEGTVDIKGMAKTNARTLKLNSEQIILLYKYLYEIRPKLIKEKTDRLLINLRGKALTKDGIDYLISTLKHLVPDKKLSSYTIRQSVIASLLKEGKDLRVVQAFAGHKNLNTTELYRETGLEALKKAVQKYHPLQ